MFVIFAQIVIRLYFIGESNFHVAIFNWLTLLENYVNFNTYLLLSQAKIRNCQIKFCHSNFKILHLAAWITKFDQLRATKLMAKTSLTP